MSARTAAIERQLIVRRQKLRTHALHATLLIILEHKVKLSRIGLLKQYKSDDYNFVIVQKC